MTYDTGAAAVIAGLLADDGRRRVFAALVLGADDLAEVKRQTGLSTREAMAAITRMEYAGLVVSSDGHYWVLAEAIREAARRAVPPPSLEHTDQPDDIGRVLRAFVRDGRLLSIPTARSKRLVVLDQVAQEFEPGETYSEAAVNHALARWHADTAALRRHLVDEAFLAREKGVYRRCGGTVRLPDD